MLRVLVLEDEDSLAHLLGIYLRRAGFDCVVCSDVALANNATATQRFDAAVLDVEQAGSNELAEQLSLIGTKVARMSGHHGKLADLPARYAGLRRFEKPFRMDDLVQWLLEVLSSGPLHASDSTAPI